MLTVLVEQAVDDGESHADLDLAEYLVCHSSSIGVRYVHASENLQLMSRIALSSA